MVIDLKSGALQPEDAGKMNFYPSGGDDRLRGSTTSPPSAPSCAARRTG
ncbi:hypothetical protein [Candidatus Amarolinea dominans]